MNNYKKKIFNNNFFIVKQFKNYVNMYFSNAITLKSRQKHPFHLVDPSPWPLTTSFGALFTTFGSVLFFHSYKNGFFLFLIGFVTVLLSVYAWWRDIIRESSFEGHHNLIVQNNLRIGMVLFIVSEIMFFFAFFWAFFYLNFSPISDLTKFNIIFKLWDISVNNTVLLINIPFLDSIFTLNVPFLNIELLSIPFLNSVLLLSSGIIVTWSHNAILKGNKIQVKISLFLTILFAIIFIIFQVYEYYNTTFCISDGTFGSCFYLLTGFHGFHVFVGTCFLIISYIRLCKNHFTNKHHFGFEAAIWYWHFVDVVWLFLFVVIYWWKS
jgi:cytochrome c oxidase subunit 3